MEQRPRQIDGITGRGLFVTERLPNDDAPGVTVGWPYLQGMAN
jgi:hypothetical protein